MFDVQKETSVEVHQERPFLTLWASGVQHNLGPLTDHVDILNSQYN